MVGETLGRIGFWLIHKAWWILAMIAGLFTIDSIWGPGWPDTWEILVGRKSPIGAPLPGCTWPLSVVGWLVVPAFIGAVASFVVADQAGLRQSSGTARQLAKQQRERGHS